MVLDRRVTLRCLTDDLSSDWGDVAQYRAIKDLRSLTAQALSNDIKKSVVARHLRTVPRLNTLSHPLLRHFDSTYEADYDFSSSESISGLTDPHWWKQKTQQWRGAATDHSQIGSQAVWLCAAGLRRDGDKSDFYKSFMRNIKRAGAGAFLPSDEDSLLGEIEEKNVATDSWKLQIHCGALALLAECGKNAGRTHSMQFPAPSRKSEKPVIGEISLSVESLNVDGADLYEAFLVAKIIDQSSIKSVDVACQIARSALQSDAEGWRSTPYVESSYAFSALLEDKAMPAAEILMRDGELPEDSKPGELRLGLRAHYSQKHGLVSAQIDGSSVLSLCGYWFVPTADHERLDTCTECSELHGQLIDK